MKRRRIRIPRRNRKIWPLDNLSMPSNSFSATEGECTQYNFPPYFFRKAYRKILRRRIGIPG